MESDRIKNQYNDAQELYNYLMNKQEMSFALYINDVYKKVLTLSAASYFESEISRILQNYAKKVSIQNDQRLVELIMHKIINRQYHTLFDWNGNNTNSFWKLFGEETKTKVQKILSSEENLKSAEKEFLTLGQLRNSLIHQNFAEYNMENQTLDEIYKKYVTACKFIEFIEDVLNPDFFSNEKYNM